MLLSTTTHYYIQLQAATDGSPGKVECDRGAHHFTCGTGKTCYHCTPPHIVTTNHCSILLRKSSKYLYCLILNTGTSHHYIPPQLHYTTAYYYVLPRHLQATTAQCQILQLHATEVIHRCERGEDWRQHSGTSPSPRPLGSRRWYRSALAGLASAALPRFRVQPG